ncbi:unnamed protein product [Choristocarpus tenellus]
MRHNVGVRHARTCPGEGGLVHQHTTMVKRLGMGTHLTMEDGIPFTVDWNFRVDVVFHAGVLVDAGSAPYWGKGLIPDVSFAEVQAVSRLPHSSTSNGVPAAAAEEQKHTHLEGPFDPRSFGSKYLGVCGTCPFVAHFSMSDFLGEFRCMDRMDNVSRPFLVRPRMDTHPGVDPPLPRYFEPLPSTPPWWKVLGGSISKQKGFWMSWLHTQ